ncbi:hypothetical protein ACIA8O_13140 [Kitasatospora sp. NPDC051853]|uniref:hypothetical protein n=1 Tax=Kitasatospora sp. NPDC051853 TaxID=3364058 RepID=UPI0037BD3D93
MSAAPERDPPGNPQRPVFPGARGFTVTLDGQDDEGLRLLLSGTSRLVRMDQRNFQLDSAGHVLTLGLVRAFHPAVTAADHERALAALTTGTAAGYLLQVAPRDGENFRLHMPDQWPDEPKPLAATPLELPGLAQPR